MQQDIVTMVVYLYIFVCIALMLFNLAYVLYAKQKITIGNRRVRRILKHQLTCINREKSSCVVSEREKKYLLRKFRKIENVKAFEQSLYLCIQRTSKEDTEEYLKGCVAVFYETAMEYKKKPAMERAYFAYVIGAHMKGVANYYQGISKILLLYLEDTTVYCWENVLQAFYSLGSKQELEQAFALMKKNGYCHEHRLIADGLLQFQGDQYGLAVELWEKRMEYTESVRVGILQFMTRSPFHFSNLLLPELEEVKGEEGFAVIRYFARHRCLRATPILVEILQREDAFSVAAAAALGSYASETVKNALQKAQHSALWYVRKNAALSLRRIEGEEYDKNRSCNA